MERSPGFLFFRFGFRAVRRGQLLNVTRGSVATSRGLHVWNTSNVDEVRSSLLLRTTVLRMEICVYTFGGLIRVKPNGAKPRRISMYREVMYISRFPKARCSSMLESDFFSVL